MKKFNVNFVISDLYCILLGGQFGVKGGVYSSCQAVYRNYPQFLILRIQVKSCRQVACVAKK